MMTFGYEFINASLTGQSNVQYAVKVMTSFGYEIMLTRGCWFQTLDVNSEKSYTEKILITRRWIFTYPKLIWHLRHLEGAMTLTNLQISRAAIGNQIGHLEKIASSG